MFGKQFSMCSMKSTGEGIGAGAGAGAGASAGAGAVCSVQFAVSSVQCTACHR